MIKDQATLPPKILNHVTSSSVRDTGIVRVSCHWVRLSGKASAAYHGDRGDKEHGFQPDGWWRRNTDGTEVFNFFLSTFLACSSPSVMNHSRKTAEALSPREGDRRPPPPSDPTLSPLLAHPYKLRKGPGGWSTQSLSQLSAEHGSLQADEPNDISWHLVEFSSVSIPAWVRAPNMQSASWAHSIHSTVSHWHIFTPGRLVLH